MKVRGRSHCDPELAEDGVLTCCGLCYWTRGQRRIFFLSLSLPVILILGLVLAILIKALTVGEKFQLEKLSDEEIEFINPDTDTQLGRWDKIHSQVKKYISSLGTNSRRQHKVPVYLLE